MWGGGGGGGGDEGGGDKITIETIPTLKFPPSLK